MLGKLKFRLNNYTHLVFAANYSVEPVPILLKSVRIHLKPAKIAITYELRFLDQSDRRSTWILF